MAYEAWTHRQKVKFDTTSNGANVANNVTNFPVLIRLDSTTFNFDQAKSDGADIAPFN